MSDAREDNSNTTRSRAGQGGGAGHRAGSSMLLDTDTVFEILESSGVGLFNIDLETGKSRVSPTWKTMIGLAPDADIEPQTEWLKRLHPDDRDRMQALDREVMKGRVPHNKSTVRLRHDDGHWVWIETNASIIKWSEDGRPLQLAGTHVDVTSEKTTRRIAMETNERNRLMLKYSPVGMAVFSENARVQDCNRVFSDMLGYTQTEVLGMNLMKLVWFDMDPDEVRRKQEFYSGKTEDITFETALLCKDKSRRHVLVKGVRFFDKDTNVRFLFQCSDITDRVKAEQQKDEFLSTVSHELRTPLTSIMGAIKLVNSGGIGPVSDPARKMLGVAERGCDTLLALVNDLLDLKSLEAGALKYEMDNALVGPIIQDAAAAMEGYLKPDQALVIDMPGRLAGAVLHVDAARLGQILANLLSNAAKFSPDDGSLRIQVRLRNRALRISVTDQGTGVPPELEGRMFRKFTQGQSDDKRTVRGTGLGLPISQRMAHDMGGTIGFFNTEKAGATFWVEFPLIDH